MLANALATGVTGAPMDYPRYKAQRLRPPGKGAFSDFAATVLNGTLQAVRRTRRSRAARKPKAEAPA